MPQQRRIVNFGGNVAFVPRHYYAPCTEAEILAILDKHASGTIRVVGARHAWSEAIVSDDVLVDLRHFRHVQVERTATGEVWATVGAGCRIKRVLEQLHRQANMTLPSLGLITEQTIAGAIATGTHGSGRHSMSHYMEEIRTAAYDPTTGKARLVVWRDGPELQAARCSLGCMGIVLSVRFRCVPNYLIAEEVTHRQSLPEVLALEERSPLMQFFLIPHLWEFFAQERQALPAGTRPTFLQRQRALFYRLCWLYAITLTTSCSRQSP